MPRESARRLCLDCLTSRAGPPKNAIAQEPAIARQLSTYNLCKALGCLPEPGGLLDQDARWVAFAAAFAGAEAEYQRSQEKKGG